MYTGEPLLAHFITHCIISATGRRWRKNKKIKNIIKIPRVWGKFYIYENWKKLPWAEVGYSPRSLNSAWTRWDGAFVFWEPTREFHAKHNSLWGKQIKKTYVQINVYYIYNRVMKKKKTKPWTLFVGDIHFCITFECCALLWGIMSMQLSFATHMEGEWQRDIIYVPSFQ